MTHSKHAPDTLARPADWTEQAACRDADPELFYPSSPRPLAAQPAIREFCAVCPVQPICLRTALQRWERYGVWGGMSASQRADLLNKRLPKDPDRVRAAASSRPPQSGRPRAECGTPGAYERHRRLNEPIDDACRAANTAKHADYRQRQEAS